MTFEDFQGWLIGKAANGGIDVPHLLKVASVSVVRHFEAADRWAKIGDAAVGKTAPLWVNEKEARIIANALKTERSADARLVRSQIQEMFADGE
jgi:hypothetical protein